MRDDMHDDRYQQYLRTRKKNSSNSSTAVSFKIVVPHNQCAEAKKASEIACQMLINSTSSVNSAVSAATSPSAASAVVAEFNRTSTTGSNESSQKFRAQPVSPIKDLSCDEDFEAPMSRLSR